MFYPQGLQSLNLKSCCFPREKRIDHYSLDPSFKKSTGKGLILFSLIQLALARVVAIQLAPSQSHDSSSSHQPRPRIWGHTRIWLLYTLWGDFLEKGVPSRPWPLHRVNSEYSGDLEEKNQAWSKSGKLGAGGSEELPRQTARKAPSRSQRSLLWWTLWGSHLTLAPHSTGYTPSPMFSTPRILHKKKNRDDNVPGWKITNWGTSLAVQWLKPHVSSAVVQVHPLVGELGSLMLCAMARKKKKKFFFKQITNCPWPGWEGNRPPQP